MTVNVVQPPRSGPTKAPASPRVHRNPERTREQVLRAAIAEFSEKGLSGARVDEIALRAGANKRMIYHYFGNKDDLFLAVLERTYDDIRHAEAELRLDGLDAKTAMRRLIEFSFDYSMRNPHFIHLLNSENLCHARHLRKSKRILDVNSPIIDMLRRLLDRGAREGIFRAGVDPLQFYVSIAALGYFYLSNIHTLSAVFGRDLTDKREVRRRREHNVAVLLAYLKHREA